MPRKRKRLAEGIFQDDSGIAIRVSVRGKPREFRKDEQGRRYKDRKNWTVKQFIVERKVVDAREHLKAEGELAKEGSLDADVKVYLKTLSGRTKEDARTLLAHWTVTFGDRARNSLTAIELRQHAATWTVPAVVKDGKTIRPERPISASTFNHRRQALISLYRALDGPNGPNPARDIPKKREQLGAPRALNYDVITTTLNGMPKSQSRARLKVMAYTGLPQMQIEKLKPTDWQQARLLVTPRRKGAGATGRWIPLSPDAQAALQEFAELDCWGSFSRSSLHKAWKAHGPKGSNPYALRHSWITELYRRSNGDVLALQQLALHSRLEQTQRYAAAALEDRMTALVLPRNLATVTPSDRTRSLHLLPPDEGSRKEAAQRRKSKKTAKSARK